MHAFFSSLPSGTFITLVLVFLLGWVIALTFYAIKAYISLEMLEISHENDFRLMHVLRKELGRVDSEVAQLSAHVRFNMPLRHVGGGGAGGPATFGGGTGGGGNGGDAKVGGYVSPGEAGQPDGTGGRGGFISTDQLGQSIKIVGKEPR